MTNIPGIDLRILSLADSKKLPEAVQQEFDHFRIQAARKAIIALVRRRSGEITELNRMATEIEALTDDNQTVQQLAKLAESVEPFRAKTGLHYEYLLLVMSQHYNPWGVVDFQRDFENPMPYVKDAAEKLWALCREHKVDVESLLAKSRDPLVNALNLYYMIPMGGVTRPLKPYKPEGEDVD